MRRAVAHLGLALPVVAAGAALVATAVGVSDPVGPWPSRARPSAARPAPSPGSAAAPPVAAAGSEAARLAAPAPVGPPAAGQAPAASDPAALAAPPGASPAAVEAALLRLRPDEARARLPGLLAGCRDAALRRALVRVDRRLRRLDDPLALADAPEVDVRRLVAAQAPAALGGHARLVEDARRPRAVRAASAAALGQAGLDAARAHLLALAGAPEAETRALAAEGLARRAGCPRSAAALTSLADDPAPAVRRAALEALRGFPECAPAVAARLAVEPDPAARGAALRALAACGGARELGPLCDLARAGPPAEQPLALAAAWAVSRRADAPWPADLPPASLHGPPTRPSRAPGLLPRAGPEATHPEAAPPEAAPPGVAPPDPARPGG